MKKCGRLLAPCEHGGLAFNKQQIFRLVAQVRELKPVIKVCNKDYEYIFSSTDVFTEHESARNFINMDIYWTSDTVFKRILVLVSTVHACKFHKDH